MKRKIKNLICFIIIFIYCCCLITGCAQSGGSNESTSANETTTSSEVDTETTITADTLSTSSNYSDQDLDSSWDTDTATYVSLKKDSITVDGSGALAKGSVLTISKKGTYVITGALTDGQIIVDAADTDKIQIVLNGVTINCSTSAPIYIKKADKVFLTLEAGSENKISDSDNYTLASGEDEPNAAIFSKEDLTINGSGSINVTGNYNRGIVSKDDLVITGGTFHITAVGNGIRGKDSVRICAGDFTIDAGLDGIQSNNAKDTAKGYIHIDGGIFNITAGNDGIQAETLLQITGGTGKIVTGGGSANASTNNKGEENKNWGAWGPQGDQAADSIDNSTADNTASAKGLKAGNTITISNGTFEIDSSDDSIHSNNAITISGGKFDLVSGDDGIHSDSSLTIDNGEINITKSYEGLESSSLTINDGTIHLVASDDGINAGGGSDSSATGGRPGQNNIDSNSEVFIKINGGYIVVDASGDGVDSNGNLFITGGTVLVNGPTTGGNGAMDYDGTAQITGGIMIAVGTSDMAEGFGDTSTQYSLMYGYTDSQSAGTSVSLKDLKGNVVVAFTPSKAYQNVLISAPGLEKAGTYTLYSGSEISKANTEGFGNNGTATGGTKITDITLSNIFTSEGTIGGGMGGNPGAGGGRPGGPGGR